MLGGGSAGCELTQVFAAFGSQVTLIEAEPGLLPSEPAFAGEILVTALRRAGAEIRLGVGRDQGRTNRRRADPGPGGRHPHRRGPAAAGHRPAAQDQRPRAGRARDQRPRPGRPCPSPPRARSPASTGPAGCGPRGTSPASRTPTPAATRPRWSRPTSSASHAKRTTAPSRAACSPRLRSTPWVEPGRPGLDTVRVSLSDTARGRLGLDDLGVLELYAADGVLAGAVAVGPDAAAWMSEVTLAIRARVPVSTLADVVHAFPTYGEGLQAAFRELAKTEQTGKEDRAVERAEHGDARRRRHRAAAPSSSRRRPRPGRGARSRSRSTRRTRPNRRRAVGFDDDDYR